MFALDQLKLAFAYHMVREIVGADGDVAAEEKRWLGELFPTATLESCGFLEQGSFTVRFEQALDQALVELPGRLSQSAKLELLETFLEASLADDELHHTEGTVILRAAHLLGVTPDELDRHLDTLDDVGSVDLDEPLEE